MDIKGLPDKVASIISCRWKVNEEPAFQVFRPIPRQYKKQSGNTILLSANS